MLDIATASTISVLSLFGYLVTLLGTGVVIVSFASGYKTNVWAGTKTSATGTIFIGLGTVITYLGTTENAHGFKVTLVLVACVVVALMVPVVILRPEWIPHKSGKPKGKKT
jgi:hypothetical protein